MLKCLPTLARMDILLEWSLARMDTCPNVHLPEWTSGRMDTYRMDTFPNVFAQVFFGKCTTVDR